MRLNNKSEIIKKEETIKIVCSNTKCKKQLLMVHHIPSEENIVLYKLRVKCPFCSRYSYDFEVCGDFKYVPCKDIILINIEEKEQLVTFNTKAI